MKTLSFRHSEMIIRSIYHTENFIDLFAINTEWIQGIRAKNQLWNILIVYQNYPKLVSSFK